MIYDARELFIVTRIFSSEHFSSWKNETMLKNVHVIGIKYCRDLFTFVVTINGNWSPSLLISVHELLFYSISVHLFAYYYWWQLSSMSWSETFNLLSGEIFPFSIFLSIVTQKWKNYIMIKKSLENWNHSVEYFNDSCFCDIKHNH